MEKIYTVAILGIGARGGDTYGRIINDSAKDRFKIVALCDLRKERLDRFGEKFGVSIENRFTDEKEFFNKKRADLLIIGTQDKDHFRHAIKGFETGYNIMVEKPLTDSRDECLKLLKKQKQVNKKALVCHVLRYAPAFLKVKELLDKGEIGKTIAIEALERVAYWHQAHSYVRGNWRNRKQSSPMILAKCCHDLDLLQYYAESKCKSVSSVGDLAYFTPNNAPDGCADRCLNCKYKDTCVYSAKKIYIDKWYKQDCPTDIWPYNIITTAPATEDKILDAIQNGPYGRCVYRCDNDVVDHQITQMTFENGIKATLTMTAFTAEGGRRINFHGTKGEIILDEELEVIYLKKFGEKQQVIELDKLNDQGYGHGGGDFFLIENLYQMMEGKANSVTSLEASVESHLIGVCAEKSRLKDGKLIFVHK